MRKFASLLVLLLLSACSLPFVQQTAAPTQAFIATAVEGAVLLETEADVATALEEAMPVIDEAMLASSCPDCSAESAGCQDSLENCQTSATEMAATIIAFEAFGVDAESVLAATATPDMSGGMPPMTPTANSPVGSLTPTPDMSAGMPALTATDDLQSDGMPTATLNPVPPLPEDGVRYRADAVIYKKNFAYPDKGCNWMGVAGQVLDGAGKPVSNLVVVAEGVLQGEEILRVDITGLHGAYGPGGYEVELGNFVVATTNMIYITVYDLDGSVLSSPVSIATRADCNQNLLILNFQQSQ